MFGRSSRPAHISITNATLLRNKIMGRLLFSIESSERENCTTDETDIKQCYIPNPKQRAINEK